MSNSRSEAAGEGTDDHLEELPDGAGCAEIWERLCTWRAERDG